MQIPTRLSIEQKAPDTTVRPGVDAHRSQEKRLALAETLNEGSGGIFAAK